MDLFEYRVDEARIAYDDSDGFWTFGSWLGQDEVEKIRSAVGGRQARVIRPMGEDVWLITLGGGRHYYVEATTRCGRCGAHIFAEETTDVGSCYDCRNAVLDEIAAGF